MRVALATIWTLVGAAMTGGAYWMFLGTPESSVPALLASALLAILAIVLAAFTINGGIEILARGLSGAGVLRALRATASVLPAAAIVLLAWWVTTFIESWIAMRSGEIAAVFIARLGWSNIDPLLTTIRYVAIWVRWVIAALLAVSLMSSVLSIGWTALTEGAWLRRALRPRAVAAATVWFVVFIALPWMFLVPWRPQNLPPTWAEFAFIAAKLSLAAVLAATGAVLIASGVLREPATSSS